MLGWPGNVAPVLYTSRSGATMSGHVWAARTGPAKRPGIVIVNGSILGQEQAYWQAAQALADAGFVVMTFDVQGEGMSDQLGEAPDQLEDAFAGTPGLGLLGPVPEGGPGLGGNGLTFYDGASDALDFFLSTPDAPFVPVPSRTTGTRHDPKQKRRVAAGLNAAYNPLWNLVDRRDIGLAGHSYGAVAASWLGQQQPRVKAVVGWDNLCIPVSPSPDEEDAFFADPVNRTVGGGFAMYGIPSHCFGAPAGPAPAITKPGLGITGDYMVPTAYLEPPNPLAKSTASRTYSASGVDSGEIVIRGGTHLDMGSLPLPGVPATLRGLDMVTYYTVAWFRKYLQHDPRADRMLLDGRWRQDSAGAAADPSHDPNLFSWHYRSRLDIGLAGGGRARCEDLRTSCSK